MSDLVRPHRQQPTRLPYPWDSPGKNTSGLPFPSPMHESEKWKWSRSVVSDSSRPHGLQPTRLLHPWDFPGKSTRVGCHCLLRPYLVLAKVSWQTSSPAVFSFLSLFPAPRYPSLCCSLNPSLWKGYSTFLKTRWGRHFLVLNKTSRWF